MLDFIKALTYYSAFYLNMIKILKVLGHKITFQAFQTYTIYTTSALNVKLNALHKWKLIIKSACLNGA